jgi:hypothetical protein
MLKGIKKADGTHLWSVCSTNQQHTACARGWVTALHLHQQLSLQTPTGLMLACSTSNAKNIL